MCGLQVAVKPKKKKESKRPRESRGPQPPKKKKRPGQEGYDPYDFTSSESEGEGQAPPTAELSQATEVAMDTSIGKLSAER